MFVDMRQYQNLFHWITDAENMCTVAYNASQALGGDWREEVVKTNMSLSMSGGWRSWDIQLGGGPNWEVTPG